MEIWKSVNNYENYEISNYGRIKCKKKWDVNKRTYINCDKILKPFDNGNGYMVIGLTNGENRRNYYVHRLVAEHFINKELGKNYINHKDHNRSNNNVANLEWCTQKENVQYSQRTNTGEKFITYRKSNNTYRIIIDNKEYPSCKTLEGAIMKRDLILKERR